MLYVMENGGATEEIYGIITGAAVSFSQILKIKK